MKHSPLLDGAAVAEQPSGRTRSRNPAPARLLTGALSLWLASVAALAADITDDHWVWVQDSDGRGVNGSVRALVVDGMGNLYVGGQFTIFLGDEMEIRNIAKWDGNGWSALGEGMNDDNPGWNSSSVYALALAGNDLYVGGDFTTAGGVEARAIAKWNEADGWSALGSGLVDPLRLDHIEVRALAVLGNDLYVGGYFPTEEGVAGGNIAKWDGSAWSVPDSGVDDTVLALTVMGGDLYVGGWFTSAGPWAGGIETGGIAKWDGNGWSALGSGVDGTVHSLTAVGGDLYVGGGFTTAGEIEANGIAKWNGNGWSALGSGVAGGVYSLTVMDGDLYVGGDFTTAGGIEANGIAKWDGSGWSALGSADVGGTVYALAETGGDLYVGGQYSSLARVVFDMVVFPPITDDNWISMGWAIPGTDGEVYAMAADDAGNLYIAGRFTFVSDVAARNIAKWDGTRWSALGSGMNNAVSSLAVLDGDLYAGGWFTTAGGITVNQVAKWDGDSWSALGSGISGGPGIFFPAVDALAVLDGDLYAGGRFATVDGVPAAGIARWDGNGWSALGSGLSALEFPIPNSDENEILVFPPWVSALAVSGSHLYVGGGFGSAGGVPANHIARWNGSGWEALGAGMGGGFYDEFDQQYYSPWVSVLAVSDGNVYAGGWFSSAGGVPANGIARWNENNRNWTAFDAGLGEGGEVSSLAVFGNDVYAAGWLPTTGGDTVHQLARWNGTSWSGLGAVMRDSFGREGSVRALVVLGGDLYIGGWFLSAGDVTAGGIAKWDGDGWSGPPHSEGGVLGMNSSVRALAMSGDDLYAGGHFTIAGGVVVNRVAKWDGNSWSPFGSGINSPVNALVVSGENIYAGGERVFQWDGSEWLVPGGGWGGPQGTVYALAVSGDDLYAGGSFTQVLHDEGDSTANSIAIWDGTDWRALGSGLQVVDPSDPEYAYEGEVYALAVVGNDLYVGGNFNRAGGVPVNGLARWDGNNWSDLGGGVTTGHPWDPEIEAVSGEVYALAVLGDDLYVGGDFTTAGDVEANSIAKWDGNSWSALGGGVVGSVVHALAVADGILYVGGSFNRAGGWDGVDVNGMARWNGWRWSAMGSGVAGFWSHPVYALAVAGNDLYVGGDFTEAGGKPSAYMARVELDRAPSVAPTLRVAGPPVFADGTMPLEVIGPAGVEIVIWASDNLEAWMPIHTESGGGSFLFDAPVSSAGSMRFYKAEAR